MGKSTRNEIQMNKVLKSQAKRFRTVVCDCDNNSFATSVAGDIGNCEEIHVTEENIYFRFTAT